MQLSRRAFLTFAAASAARLGLSRDVLGGAEAALAQAAAPPVIWLSGSGCTGCSVSLLNATAPTVDKLLTETISLKYHSTLMTAAGDLAVAAATGTAQAGGHILVVEGAIPTGFAGRCCYVWDEGGVPVTMAQAASSLAGNAAHVVAVGTCAAYGGIPAAYGATASTGLGAFLGRPVVNLPGCPAHPDWIIGSLAALLAGQSPALDQYGRPTLYYTTKKIHDRCPRKGQEEANSFAVAGGCLKELGCKGPDTHADCDIRRWNNGQSWCIGVDGLCIGCVEPKFPAFPLHKDDD